MNSADDEPEVNHALGQYLASIRADRGYSLREVEKDTDKVVSQMLRLEPY